MDVITYPRPNPHAGKRALLGHNYNNCNFNFFFNVYVKFYICWLGDKVTIAMIIIKLLWTENRSSTINNVI